MSATLAPGLARKVKKVLSIKSDAPELLGALNTLSEVYDSNTSSNRRRLRAIIEKKSVTTNLTFLEATQEVMKMLDHVQLNLNELSRCCNSISSTLSSSKSSTAALLERTEGLTAELEASLRKSELIETFLKQYQLSADEVAALTGDELNEKFFAALERVHVIHSNCRTLLRSHHQRAGLELMDSMAEYQEAAYERLCRFVQAQCRSLVDVDVPDVNPLLQHAAHALRERPVLFRYCSEEVATARHNAVFQNFVAALTQGGPGGMPRPIEIHAHDPLRYISDMFAWVHQALASEMELLVSLFGSDGASEGINGVAPRPSGEGHEDSKGSVEMPEATALIDKVFEGICRPLKVRIEQVLMSNPSMLLCFQILQLLAFYVTTLTQLAGGETHLTRTVTQVRDMASMCFHEQLKNKADKVLRYPPVPPRDLSCPPEISDLIRQLLEIVEANESSMTDGGGAEAAQSFDAIVGAVIDPLVQVCRKSSDILLSSSNLDAEDISSGGAPAAPRRPSSEGKRGPICPNAQHIFLVNCLVAIHTPLSLHRSCLPRARMLAEEIDKEVSSLVESESRRILAQCGLLEIADRVQTYLSDGGSASGPPMAADAALSLTMLAEKLRAMFVAVSAPDAVPDYEQLVAPRLRVEVAKRVSKVLADQYSTVYDAVADDANGYAQYGGISAIKNTPVQLQTVLGISERA